MRDGPSTGDQKTRAAVQEARARLARIAARTAVKHGTWWVIAAGALAAATRPFLLRLPADVPRWIAPARALALFAAGACLAAAALWALGRRRRPTEIGAARALDEALGLSEVVASGLAFARDGRDEPMAALARRRASEAVASVSIAPFFPLPPLRPGLRSTARFALCAAAAVAIGSYDPGLIQALVSPPTAHEREAAAALEDAAAELGQIAQAAVPPPSPERPSPGRENGDDKGGERGPPLADTAREAARAARRGDRKGALEKLEGIRSEASRQASRAGALGAALHKIAEALERPSGKEAAGGASKPAGAGASAEEEMHMLAQKLRSPENAAGGGDASKESAERTLERLERAAEEARKAGADGKSQGANDAARALSRAAEAMRRGDREAAAQALDQAAERARAMEQAREAAAAEAEAILELLEKSGALERAIQMALLGREGSGNSGQGMAMGEGRDGDQDGNGGKNGNGNKPGAGSALRAAIMARLAAVSAPPDGDPGTGSGPHLPDRHRARREPLVATGSVRAPSQVSEGARAIQAIRGLGRGTEPPASYREVFPSYDAAAEEGIADEHIPRERRAAVRRYFQSIRPDQP